MEQTVQDYEYFKTILTNLLNADNEIRTKAEGVYDNLNLTAKFSFLLQEVLDVNVSPEECELAAVMLRRLITNNFEEVFLKQPENYRSEVKKNLLLRVQNITNHNLRKKVCDLTAELARNCLDPLKSWSTSELEILKWPEFLEFLFMSVQVPDPQTREIALLMFAAVPRVCGSVQERYLKSILQMLCQNLSDTENPQVRQVAVKATTAFLLANEREVQVQKEFSPCITYILEYLNFVMEAQDSTQLDEVLRQLVDLAESCPQILRAHIDSLFFLCLKGISTTGYSESCIHLSLEVLVTICESAAPMVKKLAGKHVATLISFVLRLMTEIEDDPNWLIVDDDSADEENNSTSIVAESSMDRLATALGGKTMLPIIFQQLPHMLNSDNWKERCAGLMAISAIGEGCHKQMISQLSTVVDGIMPFLMDQQPRVQYAACNALGQLSTDFAPNFQKKFHAQVIPVLLPLLVTSMHARVQAHAGAALVNFFEDCPKNVLVPYLPRIAECLENVLNFKLKELVEKGTKIVLEQAVVTLAALADSAQEKFTDFYEKFMPCLKYIIKNANQPDLRLLRGKTIECVSLIGLAVGKEKFHNDAVEVMNMLLESCANSPILADDDPQLSYMIAAWARICKILGKEFQPYLQFVMEPVLKAASIKPEIAVLDSDDMKVVGNDDDWEFVNLGEKHNFGIRTAGLDEKATACQMLVWYAKELKEGFANYIKRTADIMLPMLKFYFHDSVRIAAAEILPYLIESAKASGDNGICSEWRDNILPSLLSAIESEPENEVLCELMASFAQCIEILGNGCLQNADITRLLRTIDQYLDTHFENMFEREKKRNEEIDDVLEDTLEKEDDDDVYLLSKMTELVCSMFEVHKSEFLPYFDEIVPKFDALLKSSRPWDRQWALCVFADLIECCGPKCIQYNNIFWTPLRESLKDNPADSRRDSIADLRQTASYTVGILAQFGGPAYEAPIISELIPLLIQIIDYPESRLDENERCTENAISAVTKILKFNSQLGEYKGELFSRWLMWLPIWEDEEETKFICSFLCKEVLELNPYVLGNDNCNLTRILVIFAETFEKEAVKVSSEIGQQMVFLVQKILESDHLKEWVANNLNQQLKEALLSALQPQ